MERVAIVESKSAPGVEIRMYETSWNRRVKDGRDKSFNFLRWEDKNAVATYQKAEENFSSESEGCGC